MNEKLNNIEAIIEEDDCTSNNLHINVTKALEVFYDKLQKENQEGKLTSLHTYTRSMHSTSIICEDIQTIHGLMTGKSQLIVNFHIEYNNNKIANIKRLLENYKFTARNIADMQMFEIVMKTTTKAQAVVAYLLYLPDVQNFNRFQIIPLLGYNMVDYTKMYYQLFSSVMKDYNIKL